MGLEEIMLNGLWGDKKPSPRSQRYRNNSFTPCFLQHWEVGRLPSNWCCKLLRSDFQHPEFSVGIFD